MFLPYGLLKADGTFHVKLGLTGHDVHIAVQPSERRTEAASKREFLSLCHF